MPDVRDLVVARFGPQILRPASDPARRDRVDRRRPRLDRLRRSRALRDLERIVHPRMCRNSSSGSPANPSERAVPIIVLDAAILLETGWDRVCDLVVFVDASFPVRLDRVSRIRGWTVEDLKPREAAQWPVDRKRDRADVVLRNESGLEALGSRSMLSPGRWPLEIRAPLPLEPIRREPAGTIPCRVPGNRLVQAPSRPGPSDLVPPRSLDRCPPQPLLHTL